MAIFIDRPGKELTSSSLSCGLLLAVPLFSLLHLQPSIIDQATQPHKMVIMVDQPGSRVAFKIPLGLGSYLFIY